MKTLITTAAILAAISAPAIAGGNNGKGNQCQGFSCGIPADFDWEELRGPQGEQGETGARGPMGPQGPAGASGNYVSAAAIGSLELLDPEHGGWVGGIGLTGSEHDAAAAFGIGYGTSENSMLYGKLASDFDGRAPMASVGFSWRF